MPAARTKKTKTPESVPGAGDPDRKRVLNVLAQRRYRQRQRAKIATLEAQAGGDAPLLDNTASSSKHHMDSGCLVATEIDLQPAESAIADSEAQASSMNCGALFDFDHDLFDLNLTCPNLLTPLPSTTHSPPLQFPLTPDGSLLGIPILDAIHAFANVSVAFGVVSHIWDPSYLHVVLPYIPAVNALPANLHPVPAQLTIPHHPFLDLLPWPSVREKLICMFAMPSTFRPPVAQEDDEDDEPSEIDKASEAGHRNVSSSRGVKQSKAIMQLMLDFEGAGDNAGVHVHGNTTTWGEGNELTEDSWEIGNLFYKKWWWCLDPKIVEVSNRRRRERGLSRLSMTA